MVRGLGQPIPDGFVPQWWDILSTVDIAMMQRTIAIVGTSGWAVKLSEMRRAGQLNEDFGRPLDRLIRRYYTELPRRLLRRHADLQPDFLFSLTAPYSVYTFSDGLYDAWQFNLAWHGEPDHARLIRVGLGWRWQPANPRLQNPARPLRGRMDYEFFQSMVRADPARLNRTFANPGIFGGVVVRLYTGNLPPGGTLAQRVINDQQLGDDGWRFIGYALEQSDANHRIVLEHIPNLTKLIRLIFEHIEQNGYHPQTL
jgi:hypothetical protein